MKDVELAVGLNNHTWREITVHVTPQELDKHYDDEAFWISKIRPIYFPECVSFIHVLYIPEMD